VGINDLDLNSVEVISGPASALYGANAMQGVINMTSKSAFDVQGLALQIKGGGTTVPAGYVEAQFRYAQAFGKKKNWAFKLTGSYMQTKDWAAEDDSFNRYGNIRTTQDVTFILRKKALQDVGPNFTQDSKDKLIRLNNWLDFNPIANPKNLDIQAPGYMESQMTNYKTYSLKIAGELHYKITNDIDLSYTGKFGMGNAVYQSVSRYQLKDIIFHQHKIELKGKNFVVRGYVSADDAGNSYDIRRTAQYISRASVTDYITNFNTSYFDSLRVYTDGFNADNEARNWMADSAKRVAIKYADATGWQAGGSPKFDSLYKVITSDPRGKLGTKFIDHSALYHLEAQWNFLNKKHIDMIGGGSYRAYIPASQGTIFADSLIDKGDTLANGYPNPKGRYAKIVVQEYGAYLQATVKLWKDHIRLLGTMRVDKNTNYPVRVSPRGAIVAKFGDHTIRVGVSTAFKSPTLQEQYLNLDLGVIQLIGNKDGQKNLYTYNSVLDAKEYYENNTSDPYNKEVAAKMLVKTELAPLKPEQVTSIDFGYRGDFFQKKLSIDVAGYYSWYKNFIGFTRVVRPQGGTAGEASGETDVIASIVQPTTKYYTLYQIYVNSNNIVPAWGASISASYYVGKGIAPYINYTYADLKESSLSGTGATVLSGFNAPRHKFNIGVIGTKVYKGLGFSANFKWVNSYFWQSSFADGKVPSFHTLDLQISYELEKYYSTIRVGGSNIYNNKHIEAAGSPKIGALYYVSWTFDFNKFKFMQK
jgi:outer membrane receptor protein involved in Fe transport